MTRGYGGTALICDLLDTTAGVFNTITVANTGTVAALDISVAATRSKLLWFNDSEHGPNESLSLTELFNEQNYEPDPPYLPIRNLPSGSNVVLRCRREWGAPQQDVLQLTWKTPDGQLHRSEQSWSWALSSTPR